MKIEYRWTNEEAKTAYSKLVELRNKIESEDLKAAILQSMCGLYIQFTVPMITMSQDEYEQHQRHIA